MLLFAGVLLTDFVAGHRLFVVSVPCTLLSVHRAVVQHVDWPHRPTSTPPSTMGNIPHYSPKILKTLDAPGLGPREIPSLEEKDGFASPWTLEGGVDVHSCSSCFVLRVSCPGIDTGAPANPHAGLLGTVGLHGDRDDRYVQRVSE